jgi:anthranilate phosphoribosyltransferase
MRHVGPVRRELGITSVMNIVGPLANPAAAGRQVLGVADKSRLSLLAGALASLGATHALIVHGEPGLDEISPLAPTLVLEVRDGATTSWVIEPAQFGYDGMRPEDLAGGPPSTNAGLLTELLAGRGNPCATAAVVLNAAAALLVAGRAADYTSAVAIAREGITNRAGLVALERMRLAYAAGD